MHREDGFLSTQRDHLSKSEKCWEVYIERLYRGVLGRANGKEPDVSGSGQGAYVKLISEGQQWPVVDVLVRAHSAHIARFGV
jgi:hypothetical protein